MLVQRSNVVLATLKCVWISGKELVLSEMERLAFSNFGEVVSVFKGRHEFNRKIRNGKKQVKIFPTGGDPMILPRKISFHGSIQKEKVVLATGAKLSTCLAKVVQKLHPPQKILACLSMRRVVSSGESSSCRT